MQSEPCGRTQTGEAALCLANEFMGSALLSEVQQRGVFKEHEQRKNKGKLHFLRLLESYHLPLHCKTIYTAVREREQCVC